MIYLLRHGEIEGPGGKRFIGQMDLLLNETGFKQAEWWRQELAPIVFERIFCSDLKRAVQTAAIVAGPGEDHVGIVPDFREINMGEWDGLEMRQVRDHFPEAWYERGTDPALFRPPMGESFTDVYRRVVPLFEQIAERLKGHALIVAHAGVIRVILCHVLGMSLSKLFRLDQDYGALSIIDCRNDGMRVRAMNIKPSMSLIDYSPSNR